MPERNQSEDTQKKTTEQPTPYEGLFDQITQELLCNRPTFIKACLRKMAVENPILHQSLLHGLIISPNRDLSLDWLTMYYELNFRPARVKNSTVPITCVSPETLLTSSEVEIREAKPLLEQIERVEEGSAEYNILGKEINSTYDKMLKEYKEMQLDDLKRDVEFATFWHFYNLAMLYFPSEYGERAAEPLVVCVRCLHAQRDADKFKRSFPTI